MNAVILTAALALTAPMLADNVEPGGFRPDSMPPFYVGEFFAVTPSVSGTLDRIELDVTSAGGKAQALVGLNGTVALYSSSKTALDGASGWTAFPFSEGHVEAGQSYLVSFSLPSGSYLHSRQYEAGFETGKYQQAFRLWVEPDQPAPSLIPGDVNLDGRVDLTDFGILKENFGRTSDAAVPEPNGLFLGILAAALAFPVVRRKS